MTDEQIDNLTDPEFAHAVAEMMGLGCTFQDCWKLPSGKLISKKDWHPLTSWSDWGVFYEWMIGRGWQSYHAEEMGITTWKWMNIDILETATDPDIRRAMLIAGLKAEEKGE